MSAYAMWQLNCDGPTVLGIDDVCASSLDNGTASTAREARENGKYEGWTRVGQKFDLCPECTVKYRKGKDGASTNRAHHQKAGRRRQPNR